MSAVSSRTARHRMTESILLNVALGLQYPDQVLDHPEQLAYYRMAMMADLERRANADGLPFAGTLTCRWDPTPDMPMAVVHMTLETFGRVVR